MKCRASPSDKTRPDNPPLRPNHRVLQVPNAGEAAVSQDARYARAIRCPHVSRSSSTSAPGVNGPDTLDAVTQFQTDDTLNDTGVVDDITLPWMRFRLTCYSCLRD